MGDNFITIKKAARFRKETEPPSWCRLNLRTLVTVFLSHGHLTG